MKVFNGYSYTINIVKGAKFDKDANMFLGGEIIYEFPSNWEFDLSTRGKRIEKYPFEEMPDLLVLDTEVWFMVSPPPSGYDIYLIPKNYIRAYRNIGIDVSNMYTPHDRVANLDGSTRGFSTLLSSFEYAKIQNEGEKENMLKKETVINQVSILDEGKNDIYEKFARRVLEAINTIDVREEADADDLVRVNSYTIEKNMVTMTYKIMDEPVNDSEIDILRFHIKNLLSDDMFLNLVKLDECDEPHYLLEIKVYK